MTSVYSGGSRGGAQGAGSPLFWVKKEEIAEGRKARRASKTELGAPLIQGLDPSLVYHI